jgi:hypothetical protein
LKLPGREISPASTLSNVALLVIEIEKGMDGNVVSPAVRQHVGVKEKV